VITVVGIGADGWSGLSEPARAAILDADEVIGSERQLATLPTGVSGVRTLPSPLAPLVEELAGRNGDARVAVLASGDPMLHGIGATLARRIDPGRLSVISHPSAFSLACARLGWAAADVELVSAVARAPAVVGRVLQPRRRVVVYVTGANGATSVARVVRDAGYGDSRFVVLEQLGGPEERITDTTAAQWSDRAADPLHAVAIECSAVAADVLAPLVPGLPDDAFEHDGALTKRHIRACTLAALAPVPDALLWDVGAGSGSIAIEWLRSERTAAAVAVEARADRAERIVRNARALGVPHLTVVTGAAPGALASLPPPDAIFIGGGLTTPGLIDACWDALPPNGRIVANAITLESEHLVAGHHRERGGELVRIEISHAGPIGGFTAWRAQIPVVQWSALKT
jgi:precorrin-6B C5,15-methyltransferase / cobalt-precorrin-6B C5,C15-methyltransferase